MVGDQDTGAGLRCQDLGFWASGFKSCFLIFSNYILWIRFVGSEFRGL